MSQPPSSTPPPPKYLLTPLASHEIRLLHIQPTAADGFKSPITCTLKIHSLSDKLAYDALSYTWKNAGGFKVITVNGYPRNVTSNLELALRYLRSSCDGVQGDEGGGEGGGRRRGVEGKSAEQTGGERKGSEDQAKELVLWVDALCIDQGNDGEKAVQVGMMGEIYRNAKRVRAWIGERNEEEVHVDVDVEAGGEGMVTPWTAWKLLKVFGTSNSFDCWDAENPLQLKPGKETDEMASLLTKCWDTETGQRSWRVMIRMLRHAYWRRVWIQQELYNNKEVIIHCGLKSAPFDCWVRLLEAHSYECYIDPSDRSMKLPSGKVRSGSDEVVQAGSIVYWFGLGRRFHARVVTSQGHFRLLREQLSRGATDPRDKIYGILDMVECWADGRFKADYTVSTAEVYVRAVHSAIDQWKSLDLLLDTMPCPVDMRMPGLPTWCPDWSHFIAMPNDGTEEGTDLQWGEIPYGLNRWGDNKFDYSRNVPCFTRKSDSNRVLQCAGIQLDQVRDVADGPWSPGQEKPSYVNLERLLELTGAEYDPDQREALWRTLISNRAWNPDFDANPKTFFQAPDEFGGRFETWLKILRLRHRLNRNPDDETLQPLRTDGMLLAEAVMPSEKQPGPGMTSEQAIEQIETWQVPFHQACQIASRWRRFFMTTDNHMGLAPLHVLSGDVVVVLYGATLPVILRPVGAHFEFVGECYINYCERGEALDSAERGEAKQGFFEIH